MKLLRVGLLYALPLLVVIPACDKPPNTPPKDYTFPVAGSSGPLYQPPGRKPTVTLAELDNPYTATPERKASIIGNVGRLKAGMSRSEVRTILGPPDSDHGDGTKSFKVRLAGYTFIYDLHLRGALGGNMNDSIIEVSFDDQDRLRQWWSKNVPELAGGIGETTNGFDPELLASPVRRAQIVAGVSRLHRGMRGADVAAIFGPPTSLWHLGTADEAARCDYAFYKCVSPGSYHFDGQVSVYLDAQEHPVRWEAKEVRELASNGGVVKPAADDKPRPIAEPNILQHRLPPSAEIKPSRGSKLQFLELLLAVPTDPTPPPAHSTTPPSPSAFSISPASPSPFPRQGT